MSILNRIKEASLTARKNKADEASLLITLLGEAQKIGKDKGNRDSTDEEVISVVKKFIENATQIIQYAKQLNDEKRVEAAEFEIKVISQFLPKQLSQQKIVDEILKFIDDKNDVKMGDVMAHLKQNFAGCYDGKIASQLVKECLAK